MAGRALYIHDLERPGMLWGKIKFSEYAHARIKRIDTSKAERNKVMMAGKRITNSTVAFPSSRETALFRLLSSFAPALSMSLVP